MYNRSKPYSKPMKTTTNNKRSYMADNQHNVAEGRNKNAGHPLCR